MSAELWKRALEILSLLEGLSPEDRQRVLDEECRGNEELRNRVLEMYEASETLQENSETLDEDSETQPPKPVRPGEFLGEYQVLKLLGKGGMGEVYLALRTDHASLRVDAVKVLPAEQATIDRVARAVREGETLRRLQGDYFPEYRDHGILRDQRPFLAMEFIDGLPIDEFCRKNALPLKDRLRLFRRVCGAIGTAHRSLTLHRDLKPENILVTSDGIPKILDFGIAKEINSDGSASRTLTAAFVAHFSADYASPEQIASETLTTASDIYSLGVLLYQLLTGEVPIRLAPLMPALDQVQKKIRDEQPTHPSARISKKGAAAAVGIDLPKKAVQGDLDTIVLKALRKEPSERYESTEQLSEDIRRYLEELPILAQKPTLRYRAGKMLRRHWSRALALTTAAIVLLSLWGVVEQRDAANRQYLRAERTSDFITSLFENADPFGEDSPISVESLLQIGQENLEKKLITDEDREIRAELLVTIGKVNLSLGNMQAAANLLETGVALQRELRGPKSLILADALDRLSESQVAQGQYSRALLSQLEVLNIQEENLRYDHLEIAETLHNFGHIYTKLGRPEAARQALTRSLEIKEKALASDDLSLAIGLNALGMLNSEENYHEAAIHQSKRALEIYKSSFGLQHPRTARALNSHAQNLSNAGYPDQAESNFIQAIEIQENILGPTHPDLALTLGNLGILYSMAGRYAEARLLLERCASIREATLGSDHPKFGNTLGQLALLYKRQGMYDKAAENYSRSLEILLRHYPPTHINVVATRLNISSLLYTLKRYEEAEASAQEVRATIEESGHSESHQMSTVLNHLAKIYHQTGRMEQSERLFLEAIEIRKRVIGPTHPRNASLLENYAHLLEDMGRVNEAEVLLKEYLSLADSRLNTAR